MVGFTIRNFHPKFLIAPPIFLVFLVRARPVLHLIGFRRSYPDLYGPIKSAVRTANTT